MNKVILKTVFLGLFLFYGRAHAEAMGFVRLQVNVISVEGNWVNAVYAQKKVRFPAKELTIKEVRGLQEVNLSAAEYEQMKMDYFLGR